MVTNIPFIRITLQSIPENEEMSCDAPGDLNGGSCSNLAELAFVTKNGTVLIRTCFPHMGFGWTHSERQIKTIIQSKRQKAAEQSKAVVGTITTNAEELEEAVV